MKTTAVLRKDGHPFASKNNATTRMRALGLEDSHTVETYGDGYAIFPKALNEERVTLQKGDYIATAGLSEDDYHNVARAFMAAGADRGEYPNLEYFQGYEDFGWSGIKDSCYHQGSDAGVRGYFKGRKLTLSQILNAMNAGSNTNEPTTETTPMHLTDRLESARTNLESAQAEYDALLKEHKTAYPKLHGLSVKVDIPPEEWRAGDVVECVNDGYCEGIRYENYWKEGTVGKHYVLKEPVDKDGDVSVTDDHGDSGCPGAKRFRFVSRL